MLLFFLLKDLGPLGSNWFEKLTAEASARCEQESDADPKNYKAHCDKGDYFSTPCQKPTLDSQMASTPKIFKGQGILSPETFTSEQELVTLERGKPKNVQYTVWYCRSYTVLYEITIIFILFYTK